MLTKLPELKFRRWLEPIMAPYWYMTWHEDRSVSPGVPDTHFVMKAASAAYEGRVMPFRVGWLELKASDKLLMKSNRIGVEASQHQYIRRWNDVMPIYFLVRVVDQIFLVPAEHHNTLPDCCCEADIALLSVLRFPQDEIVQQLVPYLRRVTLI